MTDRIGWLQVGRYRTPVVEVHLESDGITFVGADIFLMSTEPINEPVFLLTNSGIPVVESTTNIRMDDVLGSTLKVSYSLHFDRMTTPDGSALPPVRSYVGKTS